MKDEAQHVIQQPSALTETPDALAVANQLRPVLMRLHRYLRGEVHELGVTSTQASLLGAIQRSPDVGLSQLAEQEHISAPTLVAHIDKLEAAGLVERVRGSSSDRRRIGLRITASGATVLQTLREHRTAWLAAGLETLSPDELSAIAAAIGPLQQLTRQAATFQLQMRRGRMPRS